MHLARSRSIWLGAATVLLLALGSYILVSRRSHTSDRVYRIGWEDVPPFQQKAEDGSPEGVAIDLVRDAARRRGIKLEWVYQSVSSEAALRNKQVDLWPLITITPERQRNKAIYISKPYLQHDHTLLVPAGSRYSRVEDMASASISYVDLPINEKLLQGVLPRARLFKASSRHEAVENVCAGRTDAAFMDEFSAGTTLLGGVSCSSQPLREITMPMLRAQLGVGSTPEASAVADEIRLGIDASAVEGELAKILAKSGHSSSRNVEYFSVLLHAQRRERWLIAALVVFSLLLGLTVFAADRIRRQRNRIKATESALRESEQNLRLMANNLSEMVLAYDMDRRLVFASPAVEQLTGYSVAELQVEKSIGWVHPDDRLRIHTCWDKVFEGRAFRDEEYRLITKDGRTKWIVANWGPVHDESGEQVGVQSSERDITERKLAEKAWRESEGRFRELLEGVQLVAVITDLDGIIRFCNAYTLALTGWVSDEVIGRAASELLQPELQFQAAEDIAVPRSNPAQTFFEGSILEKNGSRRCIRWCITPLRDTAGRETGLASLGEDLTELRALRAEAAQYESEQRFRSISDTAPLMIWMAGPDKACTFVNKGWLAFTGRAPEEEFGLGWTANIHPGDLESCLTMYTTAFDARREFQMEYRKKRADGEYRWVLGSGVPCFGPDGQFGGYVGTCTDITDLKRTRDENVARQKLETVGRLAEGISHDFNNLLGGVLSQAELAAQELAEGTSPDEQLGNIRTSALRGAAIVRQLLIYAGQESGAPESVELSKLIEDMLDLLKVAVSKHVLVTTDLAHGLPAVHANPSQLRQAVMNLVTNASEAIGDHDGTITIRTAYVTEGQTGDGDYEVQLAISDTGSGINSNVKPRIFDPFFTTKSMGHGLGLAVVQKIVEGFGGAVLVESDHHRGTTFRILLPSATGTAGPYGTNEPGASTEPNGSPATVLVVEDETVLRVAVAKMLRKQGFSVLEAADGTEALTLHREYKEEIAVVLLDATIPGAPSRDVLAEVRRVAPVTSVIVTSAYGKNTVDASFSGITVDLFIRKPYQLADLVALVRSRLSSERQTREKVAWI